MAVTKEQFINFFGISLSFVNDFLSVAFFNPSMVRKGLTTFKAIFYIIIFNNISKR